MTRLYSALFHGTAAAPVLPGEPVGVLHEEPAVAPTAAHPAFAPVGVVTEAFGAVGVLTPEAVAFAPVGVLTR